MSHISATSAPALEFAFELKSLVNELNAALAAVFRPLGLTGVQAEAIMALDALGSATLKELAAHLVAESGHPSRLLTRLEKEGLVSRRSSDSDGRAVILELTNRGRFLAGQARQARAPLVAALVAAYGDDLKPTTRLIRAMRADLREIHDEPTGHHHRE